ncbi:MAG: hypothetical protein M1820_000410 [Bogoriella megaspora]|nr:MAG: hypothetical protein M1820_000410 [Bogoriella megaspora]
MSEKSKEQSKNSPTTQRPSNNARQTAQRLPAPSLFVGPPSRNASNTSLLLPSGTQPPSTTAPSVNAGGIASQPSTALPSTSNLSTPAPFPTRQRSYLDRLYPPESAKSSFPNTPSDYPGDRASDSGKSPAQFTFSKHSPKPPGIGGDATASQKRLKDDPAKTDMLWREMQNTLEEVELSATSGAHVFGEGHAAALERLRSAQIELARAWARDEGEEVSSLHDMQERMKSQGEKDGGGVAKDKTDSPQSKKGAARPGSKGEPDGADAGMRTGQGGRSQLEEEAEADIVLARRRREANDRYFERVNASVLDVVAKLDEVANAMRGVEMESKEIWGEGDSVDTASVMS